MTNSIPTPFGIAAASFVSGYVGNGSDKTYEAEKLSSRHYVKSFDFDDTDKLVYFKVKQNIEHPGLPLLAIIFKSDFELDPQGVAHSTILVVSQSQQVWAAVGRDGIAQWVAAKDLIPRKHFLKLGIAHEKGPWAEIEEVKPPPEKWARYVGASSYELVLIEGDFYEASNVICRATRVDTPAPIKKRLVFPLKDFPQINFVPQPKTLVTAQAEIWYRKTVALLEQCVPPTSNPVDRVRAMLELRHSLLKVAAQSMYGTELHDEFIKRHPLPTLEELIPSADQQSSVALAAGVAEALQLLSAPGVRCYSEFTGGMETHCVESDQGAWEFDGTRWVLIESSN